MKLQSLKKQNHELANIKNQITQLESVVGRIDKERFAEKLEKGWKRSYLCGVQRVGDIHGPLFSGKHHITTSASIGGLEAGKRDPTKGCGPTDCRVGRYSIPRRRHRHMGAGLGHKRRWSHTNDLNPS